MEGLAMTGRTVLFLFLAVIPTASAIAQSAGTLSQLLNAAPAGRSIDAGESEFEIQAATDDTNATIKASRNISHATTFTTLQLTASAPLNESRGSTDIAAWSGSPDAFTLTGKYTGYWARGRKSTAADL
jgi:hypothetical protein